MPVKVHDNAAVMERTAWRGFRSQFVSPDNINVVVESYFFQIVADLSQNCHLDSDEVLAIAYLSPYLLITMSPIRICWSPASGKPPVICDGSTFKSSW